MNTNANINEFYKKQNLKDMELTLKELKYVRELTENDKNHENDILTEYEKRELRTKIDNEIYSLTFGITRREDLLFRIVEKEYGINKKQLLKADRKRDMVDIRRAMFAILRKYYSLAKIGEIMNRDHATTAYNYKMHNQLYGTDYDYTRVYNTIVKEYEKY